jgi:hypothetical protein
MIYKLAELSWIIEKPLDSTRSGSNALLIYFPAAVYDPV